MLTGREGHNAAAVNGLWYYWRVKGGRLAFQRQIVLPSAEEDGDDGPSPQLLRLFLYYVPPTDAFVISDSCDATVGSIMADCGPIGEGMDLEQNWRVWDGGGWKEDRNVEAEIRVPVAWAETFVVTAVPDLCLRAGGCMLLWSSAGCFPCMPRRIGGCVCMFSLVGWEAVSRCSCSKLEIRLVAGIRACFASARVERLTSNVANHSQAPFRWSRP
ncbi:unnamed protein product [Symbiodinium sp. KB8]|nr:unnamed protein product [Symbiodinium sp. KB8]